MGGGGGGDGASLQPLKTFKAPELMGTFFSNFEVITEELQIGRAIAGVGSGQTDDWLLINSKDNLIRRGFLFGVF